MYPIRLAHVLKDTAAKSRIVLLLCFLAGCSSHKLAANRSIQGTVEREESAQSPSSPEEATENTAVPKSLTTVGEVGEDAYDYAKAQDWQKLQIEFTKLQQAKTELKAKNIGTKPEWNQLTRNTVQLSEAIQGKSQLKAMQAANNITVTTIEMSRNYHQQLVPPEVALLDSDGRQLEIGVLAKDEAQLNKTKDDIKQTWQAVKPDVQGHGGQQEARRFDNLIGQLDKSQSDNDYKHVAGLILEQVDQLESVFTRK